MRQATQVGGCPTTETILRLGELRSYMASSYGDSLFEPAADIISLQLPLLILIYTMQRPSRCKRATQRDTGRVHLRSGVSHRTCR